MEEIDITKLPIVKTKRYVVEARSLGEVLDLNNPIPFKLPPRKAKGNRATPKQRRMKARNNESN